MKSMVYLNNHPNKSVCNKPKKVKQVLTEKGLWRNQTPNGCVFFLEYSINFNCPGCDSSLNSDCYARALMSK